MLSEISGLFGLIQAPKDKKSVGEDAGSDLIFDDVYNALDTDSELEAGIDGSTSEAAEDTAQSVPAETDAEEEVKAADSADSNSVVDADEGMDGADLPFDTELPLEADVATSAPNKAQRADGALEVPELPATGQPETIETPDVPLASTDSPGKVHEEGLDVAVKAEAKAAEPPSIARANEPIADHRKSEHANVWSLGVSASADQKSETVVSGGVEGEKGISEFALPSNSVAKSGPAAGSGKPETAVADKSLAGTSEHSEEQRANLTNAVPATTRIENGLNQPEVRRSSILMGSGNTEPRNPARSFGQPSSNTVEARADTVENRQLGMSKQVSASGGTEVAPVAVSVAKQQSVASAALVKSNAETSRTPDVTRQPEIVADRLMTSQRQSKESDVSPRKTAATQGEAMSAPSSESRQRRVFASDGAPIASRGSKIPMPSRTESKIPNQESLKSSEAQAKSHLTAPITAPTEEGLAKPQVSMLSISGGATGVQAGSPGRAEQATPSADDSATENQSVSRRPNAASRAVWKSSLAQSRSNSSASVISSTGSALTEAQPSTPISGSDRSLLGRTKASVELGRNPLPTRAALPAESGTLALADGVKTVDGSVSTGQRPSRPIVDAATPSNATKDGITVGTPARGNPAVAGARMTPESRKVFADNLASQQAGGKLSSEPSLTSAGQVVPPTKISRETNLPTPDKADQSEGTRGASPLVARAISPGRASESRMQTAQGLRDVPKIAAQASVATLQGEATDLEILMTKNGDTPIGSAIGSTGDAIRSGQPDTAIQSAGELPRKPDPTSVTSQIAESKPAGDLKPATTASGAPLEAMVRGEGRILAGGKVDMRTEMSSVTRVEPSQNLSTIQPPARSADEGHRTSVEIPEGQRYADVKTGQTAASTIARSVAPETVEAAQTVRHAAPSPVKAEVDTKTDHKVEMPVVTIQAPTAVNLTQPAANSAPTTAITAPPGASQPTATGSFDGEAEPDIDLGRIAFRSTRVGLGGKMTGERTATNTAGAFTAKTTSSFVAEGVEVTSLGKSLDDPESFAESQPLSFVPADARTPTAAPGHFAPQAHARAEHAASVVRQLADAIADGPSGSEDSIELRLSPEELGSVRFKMMQGENGLMMHIAAERPETLDMLRRNIDQLSRYLSDLGYASTGFTFGDGQTDSQSGGGHSAPVTPQDIPQTGDPADIAAPLSIASGGLDLRI